MNEAECRLEDGLALLMRSVARGAMLCEKLEPLEPPPSEPVRVHFPDVRRILSL